MAGGLINIVSYGLQDLYLTGTPQISFFKVVYRRHTNFSIESVELPFDDDVGFNTTSNLTLPIIGDLVNKMYLKIDLPEISFKRVTSTEDIRDATIKYNIAKAEYRRFITFFSVNSDAYRAAIEIYNANNIQFSTEMVFYINSVFASYSNNKYVNSTLKYYENNTPISYITPDKFNLQVIVQCLNDPCDPNPDLNPDEECIPPYLFSKDKLKTLIDNAIEYCGILQEHYESALTIAKIALSNANNSNFKFAWVDKVGHAIIDYVDVSIGGERIDKHPGDWLNIWYQLAGKKHLEEIYDKMIGNVPELKTFDRTPKPAYSLYIPLQFWFNRFTGLSIPLVSLQYHDVTINIRLKKFSQCSYIENMSEYETTDPNFSCSVNLDNMFDEDNYSIGVSLFTDYVYLDRLERRRFAQSSHEYLITQLQVLTATEIDQNNIQARVDFTNPCNELVWVIQKNSYVTNPNGFTKLYWDNYSTTIQGIGNSVNYASLEFNGYSRIDRYNGMFFNYLQPYYCHSNTPSDGINVYSFCLKPEEHQPTGSCNFSRIKKTNLQIWINDKMFINDNTEGNTTCQNVTRYYAENNSYGSTNDTTTVNMRLYTQNYNVLRILSGIAGLAYQ